MTETMRKPDLIFETSWEVCNKVGGIYTVLSSRAKTLLEAYKDHLVFLGPDLWKNGKENPDFKEDKQLLKAWREAAHHEGLTVRIGRWQIEGKPVAVLVDFEPFYARKNEIYAKAWEDFGVDSLQAYGDYDEASMFSYAAGRFVEIIHNQLLKKNCRVVYQAHEWMSGLGMLHLKKTAPSVATIFTTHATSIGRSICSNDKLLYKYFHGYDGDQMARELHMEAKHSVEKRSAWEADCFTTVSSFTDRECKQLLQKAADVVLPNGFDTTIVPKGRAFTNVRATARKRLLAVASALTGEPMSGKTLIVSTSGRNDYRCKGFDVYIKALANLNEALKRNGSCDERVLALIEVPCWTRDPRKDLVHRLESKEETNGRPLENPFITHDLFNFNEDRIVCTLRSLGMTNEPGSPVKVVLIPCYLDKNDGVIGLHYYEALTANDLCVYPSYYEPWGYTPLEACAFRTPCVTTDLSGFGQWVDATLQARGRLEDGVEVLHRDDDNFEEVADRIAATIHTMLEASAPQRNKYRKNASALAEKAQWSRFTEHYYEAYDFALRAMEERRKK